MQLARIAGEELPVLLPSTDVSMADEALYEAKHAGRNKVFIHKAESLSL